MSAARAAVQRALIAAGGAVTVTTLADRLGQHPNTVREHLDALVADDRVERLRSRPVGRGRPAWLYRAVGPSSAPVDGLDSAGEEYAALALALIDQVASSSPDPRGMARQAGERWGRTLAEQRLERRTGQRAGDPDGRPDLPAGEQAAVRVETCALTAVTDTAGMPADASLDRIPADPAPAATGSPSDMVIELLTELRFEPEPAAVADTHRLTTCPLLDAARRNPDVVCEVHLGIVRGVLERLGGEPDGAGLVPFAEPGACLLTLPDRR